MNNNTVRNIITKSIRSSIAIDSDYDISAVTGIGIVRLGIKNSRFHKRFMG